MIKNDRTKLELIRLEGIRYLITNKIPKNELDEIIKEELKIESKDCFELLKKLNRYQLIKIIEYSNKINSDDIDSSYEQFRYGLKPGFTIFSFISSSTKIIDTKSATSFINERLNEIKYFEDSKFKNLKLKDILKINNNTYEFSFTYLSKYTYISENDEPNYIYELKDCFVWLNVENTFVAVKNCPNDIQNKILNIFSEFLGTPLYNIKITRKLINEVFNGNIKKGTFVKPDANDEEVAKITIADDKLSTKKIFQNDVSSYDMSNTFLDEQLDDDTKSTLGINCNAGKIYLTRNVNATQFRNWSIDCINKITNYLNDTQNCSELEIFESKNILANTKYNKETKKIIEEICYNIFLNINSGETSFIISDNIFNIYEKLKNKFYTSLFGFCEVCEEQTKLYCPNCNSCNLKIIKDNIVCLDCGENLRCCLCDEGHNIYINDISELLNLIPTREFIDEINNLLYTNFNVRLEGTFTMDNNHLNIHKNLNGQIVDVLSIEEFKTVLESKVDNIEETLNKYNKIKEKCKNCSNNFCSMCDKTNDLCIMKLFVGFGDYRPSPHQGQEFGDVNFKITYIDGKKYNFVGIAKSKTKSGVLNLSDKESREMIQQIITMSRDKRVDLIGAICPARFHDQLKQELYYIADITNTKIVILDDIFMCKLLTYKNI